MKTVEEDSVILEGSLYIFFLPVILKYINKFFSLGTKLSAKGIEFVH